MRFILLFIFSFSVLMDASEAMRMGGMRRDRNVERGLAAMARGHIRHNDDEINPANNIVTRNDLTSQSSGIKVTPDQRAELLQQSELILRDGALVPRAYSRLTVESRKNFGSLAALPRDVLAMITLLLDDKDELSLALTCRWGYNRVIGIRQLRLDLGIRETRSLGGDGPIRLVLTNWHETATHFRLGFRDWWRGPWSKDEKERPIDFVLERGETVVICDDRFADIHEKTVLAVKSSDTGEGFKTISCVGECIGDRARVITVMEKGEAPAIYIQRSHPATLVERAAASTRSGWTTLCRKVSSLFRSCGRRRPLIAAQQSHDDGEGALLLLEESDV